MADHLSESSSLVKRYVTEIGSASVNGLVSVPSAGIARRWAVPGSERNAGNAAGEPTSDKVPFYDLPRYPGSPSNQPLPKKYWVVDLCAGLILGSAIGAL